MTVPHRIEEGGGGFMGRPLRDIWLVGMGIALGLIIALWLPGPIWLRVSAAVLTAGLGLVVGLGRVHGRWRFEEWIVHVLRHRMRPRVSVFRRRMPGEQEVTASWVPVGVSADEREGFVDMPLTVDLGWGVITVFVLSLMSGVSVYLGSGGAEDLLLHFRMLLYPID